MARATMIIKLDDAAEVEACDRWFERWGPSLFRKSENYGCGCCVDIYDVEGSQEAIDSIPETSRTSEGEWAETGQGFGGGGGARPESVPAHRRAWWRFW